MASITLYAVPHFTPKTLFFPILFSLCLLHCTFPLCISSLLTPLASLRAPFFSLLTPITFLISSSLHSLLPTPIFSLLSLLH